jgi:hypothetical protein
MRRNVCLLLEDCVCIFYTDGCGERSEVQVHHLWWQMANWSNKYGRGWLDWIFHDECGTTARLDLWVPNHNVLSHTRFRGVLNFQQTFGFLRASKYLPHGQAGVSPPTGFEPWRHPKREKPQKEASIGCTTSTRADIHYSRFIIACASVEK